MHIIICLIIFLTKGYGQSQRKKQLLPEDYDLFGTLYGEKISPDGKWISYHLIYDTGQDTLFLQETIADRKYTFPVSSGEKFSPEGKWFTAANPEKGTLLKNLSKGSEQWFEEAKELLFMDEGKYVVILQQKKLTIINLETAKELAFKDVEGFSAKGNVLVYYTTQHMVVLREKNNFIPEILMNRGNGKFSNFIWSDDATTLAFLEEHDGTGYQMVNHTIWYCDNVAATGKVYHLTTTQETTLKDRFIVTPLGKEALALSPNGTQVVFNVAVPEKEAVQPPVEVWDARSPLEYPRQRGIGNGEGIPTLVVWQPKSEYVTAVSSREHPEAWLTATHTHAISYNLLDYEPQYYMHAKADMLLTNCLTGTTKPFLKAQMTDLQTMGSSLDGKYIGYYRGGNWWVYDIEKDAHTNITKDWEEALSRTEFELQSQQSPYGVAAWATDGRLIIYTLYDIWIVSPDGKKRTRITDSGESHTVFRIAAVSEIPTVYKSYEMLTRYYDLSKGLVIEATTIDKASGWYLWHKRTGLTKWYCNNNRNTRLKRASQNNSYVFIQENATVSPRIMYSHNVDTEPRAVYRSNPQQDFYVTGHTEWLSYQSSDGKGLNGILYYPSNYRPGQKYPMIVSIYETQGQGRYAYQQPSRYAQNGFSPAAYTATGYLVFLPDISYTLGETGRSATDCVERGVKEVIKKRIVEENHIGIIGHSYGGFEVSFIMTQSRLFAAAVAGSCITDMVSGALSMNEGAARSQMWRYETYQHRIGVSLYEGYEKYQENSPIAYANHITTPLLSWHGKEDMTVDYRQSMELHLAMRRLNKRHILLLYEGEGHLLDQMPNQLDLNSRIKDWFGHYLKDIPFEYSDFKEH